MSLVALSPGSELRLAYDDVSLPPTGPDRSIVRDLTCLHCGFVSGQFVVEIAAGVPRRTIRASGDCPADALLVDRKVRCCRCGGPVSLDEERTVLHYPAEPLFRSKRKSKAGTR